MPSLYPGCSVCLKRRLWSSLLGFTASLFNPLPQVLSSETSSLPLFWPALPLLTALCWPWSASTACWFTVVYLLGQIWFSGLPEASSGKHQSREMPLPNQGSRSDDFPFPWHLGHSLRCRDWNHQRYWPLHGPPGAYNPNLTTFSQKVKGAASNCVEKQEVAENRRPWGEGPELYLEERAKKDTRSGERGPRPSPQFCGLAKHNGQKPCVGTCLCPCWRRGITLVPCQDLGAEKT